MKSDDISKKASSTDQTISYTCKTPPNFNGPNVIRLNSASGVNKKGALGMTRGNNISIFPCAGRSSTKCVNPPISEE